MYRKDCLYDGAILFDQSIKSLSRTYVYQEHQEKSTKPVVKVWGWKYTRVQLFYHIVLRLKSFSSSTTCEHWHTHQENKN